MLSIIQLLEPFLHLDKVRIDSFNFLLHYKLSLSIFLLASLLTSTGQFFGKPIICTGIDGVSEEMINSFCWIHQTYTVTSELPAPAVDVIRPGAVSGKEFEVKTPLGYYQWVSLVLFLQAVSFYIPKFIWMTVEDKKVESLIQKNLKTHVPDKDEKEKELNKLAEYWTKNRGTHTRMALTYLFCEVLNLANAIGQIFFIDFFLDYEFSTFGSDVVNFSLMPPNDRVDPLSKVFPKMSKCDFFRYGRSGAIEKYDSLCVLPINSLNEKIYIVIWFWLVVLSMFSTVYLLYLTAITLLPSYRVKIISSKVMTPILKKDLIKAVHSDKLNWFENFGDWLLLDTLFWNIDRSTNSDIILRIISIPFQTDSEAPNSPVVKKQN